MEKRGCVGGHSQGVLILLRAAVTLTAAALLTEPAVSQERQKPGPGQVCTTTRPTPPVPVPISDSLAQQRNEVTRSLLADIKRYLDGQGHKQIAWIVFHGSEGGGDRRIELVDLNVSPELRERIDTLGELIGQTVVLPVIPLGFRRDTSSATPVFCQAALRNGTTVSRRLQSAVREYPGGASAYPSGPPATAHLRVFVTHEGKPLVVRVHRSSGDTFFDRVALQIGRSALFYPPLRDGYPEWTWPDFPLVFMRR